MSKKKVEQHETKINTCPFCKLKKTTDERFCFSCGLDFSELEKADFNQTKKRIKEKKFAESLEGEVVLSSAVPAGLNISLLRVFCFMLGFFGIHNFYIGRTVKGITILTLAVLSVITYILDVYVFTDVELTSIFGYFTIFPFVSWIMDSFNLIKGKLLIPALLKTPVNIEKFYSAAGRR